jgi:hypothetical protein
VVPGRSTRRKTSAHARRLAPLNKVQRDELCRAAAVPSDQSDHFISAVEKCLAVYFRVKNQKSAVEVEMELDQTKARVRRCLQLLHHKTWRPGKFREGLKAVSAELDELSPRAREYLQFRNTKLAKAIPEGWRPEGPSDVVVDPICFRREDEQVQALKLLFGALSGPVSMSKRGRQEVYPEQVLYHCLGHAFRIATGKVPSDSSTRFMAFCSDIKNAFHLDDWRPESLARSARAHRFKED